MPAGVTLKLKRGTSSSLAAANPVLAAGEMALEQDTRRIKIGDGSTSYTSLPYTVDPEALAEARLAAIVNSGTLIAPAVGTYITQQINAADAGTLATSADLLRAAPFFPTRPHSIDRLGISVTAALSSGADSAYLYIYSSDPVTQRPASQLLASPQLTGFGTTGAKEAPVSFTFEAFTLYWLVLHIGCVVTLRSVVPGATPAMGILNNNASQHYKQLSNTRVISSPPPATWTTAVAGLSQANPFLFYMRISA